jgi:hypothetical protein
MWGRLSSLPVHGTFQSRVSKWCAWFDRGAFRRPEESKIR